MNDPDQEKFVRPESHLTLIAEIRKTQHFLDARMDDQLRGLGLGAGLYFILEDLAERPGAHAASIARRQHLTRQSLARSLKRLERIYLIEPSDRYGKMQSFRLTDLGRRRLSNARRSLDTILGPVARELDTLNCGATVASLRALRTAARAPNAPIPPAWFR